jgi:hypothetical protein
MEEIYTEVKRKNNLRKLAGLSMIIFGFAMHLVPLVPGTWAIVIGLEILGIRLLVQDILKNKLKNSKWFHKGGTQ